MRFVCLIIVSSLLLVNHALANNTPSAYLQESEDDQYQCLLRGTGVIEPPYDYSFQFLLVFQPSQGYLIFTFDYPLDPTQEEEVGEYQAEHSLDWSGYWFKIEDQVWSVVIMPIATGDPQELARVFLNHLQNLSFITSLEDQVQ